MLRPGPSGKHRRLVPKNEVVVWLTWSLRQADPKTGVEGVSVVGTVVSGAVEKLGKDGIPVNDGGSTD